MPRVGTRRRKTRTHQEEAEGERAKKYTPRCFVVKRGAVGGSVEDLIQDFRNVMLPNCAKALKEGKNTKVRDYIAIASTFGVTHLIAFRNTDFATTMSVARLPQGPTLTFKVAKYTLSREIQGCQKRRRNVKDDLRFAPLLVMNAMGQKDNDTKLMTEVLRNMFPPIDVDSFVSSSCRRVALFHQEKNGNLQFRHYAIAQKVHGVSRSVNKLLGGKVDLALGSQRDIGDFVLRGGYASDSEVEDSLPAAAPRPKKRARAGAAESVAVNLVEIGPRLELIPVKAQDGVMDGIVLFHKFITKTPEEAEAAAKRAEQRMADRDLSEKLAVKKDLKRQMLRKKRANKEKKKEDALREKFLDADDGPAALHPRDANADHKGTVEFADRTAKTANKRYKKKKHAPQAGNTSETAPPRPKSGHKRRGGFGGGGGRGLGDGGAAAKVKKRFLKSVKP